MGFKIFVGVCLVLIIALLGLLTGTVIYTDVRISRESQNVSGKVDKFTQNVNDINTNLQNINSQLQSGRQAAGLP
ncbi:MAG TPA: hypothetical protein VGM08_04285 [Candidatus Saccharimonadales bacterium]|jgi:CHASE3 domain sensor protein